MATLSSLANPMTNANDILGYANQNYGNMGNGNYTLNGFRFNDATANSIAPAAQFNNLMNQGNVNGAYSMLTTGNNAGTQLLKGALQGNPDFMGQIVNTFAKGGTNSYFGDQYGNDYNAPNEYGHFGVNGQWINGASPRLGTKAYAQQYGNGFLAGPEGAGLSSNFMAGVPSTGTPLGQTGAPGTNAAPAPNTAGTNPSASLGLAPGQGTDYTQPITNPSAYLDPSMAFTMQQGMNQLQNSAAASGNLLSGQTLKGIEDYAQGLAGTNWQNAFNNAQTDQNRLYNIDNNDRNFAYNAAVNDRNYNTGVQQNLAQMGLTGTQGNSSLASTLAALLSGNSIAAGQAQGAGTLGANNSLTNAISSILSQMYGNNIISQLGIGDAIPL